MLKNELLQKGLELEYDYFITNFNQRKKQMTFATAEKLISDILSQDDVILSINSGSGICEARVEKNLPFRIREQWATIGYEDRSWHIHLNLEEFKDRFVTETRTNG